MADLILSPIADNIVGSLGSAAVREIATLWGVNEELEELKKTISLIKGVLRDAEKKQVHNDGVRIWLRSLGDAVHEADDLIDEFDTEALRRRLKAGDEAAKQVRTFFSASNQLAFRHKLGRRIQEIRKKLFAASNDRSFLLLKANSSDEESEVVRIRETHSFMPEEEIIGRDEERDAIVKLLLECLVSGENVSVIPIVGMGGLGKTTLAQSVFNDDRVQKHFELKAWVCVSDNFDLKAIARTITKSKEVELDQLQHDLRKMLSGKRYLLVLDDIWEENREKWLGLKNLLICGAEGSRVVVTTRSTTVASATSPEKPYQLGILDEEKSWSLFKKMAFRGKQEETNLDLVGIGKEILKRCGGVPLAIRTIGNTLYCKHSKSHWHSFEKEFSKIPREGTILPTLRLSYDHLSTHLKHCFAYCRLFPKDHRIEIPKLIQLWMAQGFLKLRDSSHDQYLEDVGYRFFLDLFESSFFQEAQVDKLGIVKSCKMHDLIHDLAVEVAESEHAIGNWNSEEENLISVRHMSIDSNVISRYQILTSLRQVRTIRTLLLLHGVTLTYEQRAIWYPTISKCKQLRALDLRGVIDTDVPEFVSRFKHMRYIDLSWNGYIKNLPNSISDMINLQTLKLNFCGLLQELPRDIKKLVNLRHLEIDGCYELRHMPAGFGQLTKLTTLSMYVLPTSIDSAVKRGGGLRELVGLNNLSGKLIISNLGHKNTEVKFANLKEKQYLHSLHLEWERTKADITGSAISFEFLEPHRNLQKLSLRSYKGVKLPSWLPSLTNLVSLSLFFCDNCKHLIPTSQFQSLRKLEINTLPLMEYITDENANNDSPCSSPALFPSLQKLTLSGLPNLRGWWREYAESDHKPCPYFPRLTTLKIQNCPNLTCMPLYPHLEELILRETSLKPFRQTMLSESSSSISCLSKLKSLEISEIDGLECLPEWFRGLSCLQKLKIRKCSSMVDLSPGILYLTSLKDLRIWSMDFNLNNVDETVWKALNGRLMNLTLSEFHKMETFSEGIRQVTSLRRLHFWYCDAMTTIPEWIADLSSLKSLLFHNCPKLASIPEGIRSLTSLEMLDIAHCPVLLKRCQRQIGDDWPKISHIPHVHLSPDPNKEKGSEGSEAPEKKWKLLKGCLS